MRRIFILVDRRVKLLYSQENGDALRITANDAQRGRPSSCKQIGGYISDMDDPSRIHQCQPGHFFGYRF